MRQAKLSSLGTFAGSALAAVMVCNATTASAQDVARGLQRFTEMECSECHGMRAQGDFGPAIAGTKLRVADVRLQVRAPSSRRMPAFSAEQLTEQDVLDIYAYLSSLSPPTLAGKRTWWAIDLLNLPTPQMTAKHEMELHFTHRFSDSIRDAGSDGLYGLDSFAFPAFWFSYGLTDRIAPYFGRSANLATFEYGVKVALMSEDALGVPLSIAANVGGTYLDANGIETNSRFTAELPIGMRLGDRVAFEAVPIYSTNPDDQNAPDSPAYAFALGLGASIKLSTKYSLDGEWITNIDGFERAGAADQWQAGVTIHINRHVFQLLVANGVNTTPDAIAAGTFRTGIKSNVRIGFNLIRTFAF